MTGPTLEDSRPTDLLRLCATCYQACVPCHKAKRRCDGGLPCSNCDFSGRGCSYSDSQGNAVQPTARAKPPTSNLDTADDHAETLRPEASTKIIGGTMPIDDFHVLQSIAPFNSLVPLAYHPHHQVPGSIKPSALLSLAIGCLTKGRTHGRHEADKLAAASRSLLLEEDGTGLTALDHPTAEIALALVILAIEEGSSGKLNRAVAHSGIACRMIQDLGLPDAVHQSCEPFHPYELSRLVCVAYVVDITVSTLAGRPPCVGLTDLDIATAQISSIAGADGTSTLFATLLRSAAVFVMALDHQRKVTNRVAGTQDDIEAASSVCHRALSVWADDLPASLVFDDNNLARASRAHHASNYSTASIQGAASINESAWGWAFTLMHCFAEMAVCVLESAAGSARVRRGAACSNLTTLLLETMDRPNRMSLLSLLPLLVAAQGSSNLSIRVSGEMAESTRLNSMSDDQVRRARVFMGISVTSASYLSHSRSLSGDQRQQPLSIPTPNPPAFSTMPSMAGPTSPHPMYRHGMTSNSSYGSYGLSTAPSSSQPISSRSPVPLSDRTLPSLRVTLDDGNKGNIGGAGYATAPQVKSSHSDHPPTLRSPSLAMVSPPRSSMSTSGPVSPGSGAPAAAASIPRSLPSISTTSSAQAARRLPSLGLSSSGSGSGDAASSRRLVPPMSFGREQHAVTSSGAREWDRR